MMMSEKTTEQIQEEIKSLKLCLTDSTNVVDPDDEITFDMSNDDVSIHIELLEEELAKRNIHQFADSKRANR